MRNPITHQQQTSSNIPSRILSAKDDDHSLLSDNFSAFDVSYQHPHEAYGQEKKASE